jgi:hypothetical protein
MSKTNTVDCALHQSLLACSRLWKLCSRFLKPHQEDLSQQEVIDDFLLELFKPHQEDLSQQEVIDGLSSRIVEATPSQRARILLFFREKGHLARPSGGHGAGTGDRTTHEYSIQRKHNINMPGI